MKSTDFNTTLTQTNKITKNQKNQKKFLLLSKHKIFCKLLFYFPYFSVVLKGVYI